MATVRDRGRANSITDVEIPTKVRFAATNSAAGRYNGVAYTIPAHPAIFGDEEGEEPENTVLPLITGTILEGETLSVSTGTWSGDPDTYEYQWYRGAP